MEIFPWKISARPRRRESPPKCGHARLGKPRVNGGGLSSLPSLGEALLA